MVCAVCWTSRESRVDGSRFFFIFSSHSISQLTSIVAARALMSDRGGERTSERVKRQAMNFIYLQPAGERAKAKGLECLFQKKSWIAHFGLCSQERKNLWKSWKSVGRGRGWAHIYHAWASQSNFTYCRNSWNCRNCFSKVKIEFYFFEWKKYYPLNTKYTEIHQLGSRWKSFGFLATREKDMIESLSGSICYLVRH